MMAPFRAPRAPSLQLLLALLAAMLLSVALVLRERRLYGPGVRVAPLLGAAAAPARARARAARPAKGTAAARVLVVTFAIPRGLRGVVRASQHAYAARHGYDFREVRSFVGNASRGHTKRAASLQKLLACTLARGHEFVLVLDQDVVVAPWAPPIHVAGRRLGRRLGIVDENQPGPRTPFLVKRFRLAQGSGVPAEHFPLRDAREYYASQGFPGEALGVLNTGVMLMQPAVHGKLLERLYYKHLDRQLVAKGKFHYEQAMLGRELIDRGLHGPLPHAWNRLWVFYNWSAAVGGERFTREQVFRQSYFMHFCWMKNDLNDFAQSRARAGLTFDPQPFATDVLP